MHIRGTAAVRAAVEALESRELLSVTVDAKKRSVTVTGTSADDDISIRAHRNLINVVDVVIRNQAGRTETFVSTGVTRTINVVAGDGNDHVAIDNTLRGLAGDASVWIDAGAGDDTIEQCVLGGTIKMGAGNDRVKVATTTDKLYLYGGAGDDHLEFAGGPHSVYGEDGDDTITLGDGYTNPSGGAGDDVISVVASSKAAASIYGEAGDDRITVRNAKGVDASKTLITLYGGDGRDTLIGSDAAPENLKGGAGDDLLAPGKSRGDSVAGEAGNDLLDATGSTGVSLYGGDGDDDLYAGTSTYGYGGVGHDWFSTDGTFYVNDYDKKSDRSGKGSKNFPSYYGGGYSSGAIATLIGGDLYDGLLVDVPRLVKMDDLGFIVAYTSSTSVGRSVATGTGTGSAFTSLTVAERKSLRDGVVRLPPRWSLGDASPGKDGVMWYTVRGASGGSGYASEFGSITQLCVRAGTVLVTPSASTTSSTDRIARVRADAPTMSVPDGATAWIAGAPATTYVTGGRIPQSAVKAKSHQRGLLVEGGVIWLPFGGATTKFSKLKFA